MVHSHQKNQLWLGVHGTVPGFWPIAILWKLPQFPLNIPHAPVPKTELRAELHLASSISKTHSCGTPAWDFFGIRIWGSFMGIYWGFIYIYIAKKMRWFAIFIRENVGYNRIYCDLLGDLLWIYSGCFGNWVGIDWGFHQISWDPMGFHCDWMWFNRISFDLL